MKGEIIQSQNALHTIYVSVEGIFRSAISLEIELCRGEFSQMHFITVHWVCITMSLKWLPYRFIFMWRSQRKGEREPLAQGPQIGTWSGKIQHIVISASSPSIKNFPFWSDFRIFPLSFSQSLQSFLFPPFSLGWLDLTFSIQVVFIMLTCI